MEDLVFDFYYKGSVTLIEDVQEVTAMTYEEIINIINKRKQNEKNV
tara:strand:- start:198 stop:335 length:138 start_codon:yes stop_codon:yes gene_type:complete